MSNVVVVERVSGHRLEVRSDAAVAVVDRSVEQGGRGDGFRSVELLLGALGSCTVGTMLTYAQEHGIEVGEVRAELRAITSLATDTVSRAKLTLRISGAVSGDELERLTSAAESCKVHRSLHEGIATTLRVSASNAAPR